MNEGNTNMVVSEKAELLRKVREAVEQVETDFQAKKPATEELLQESQAKQSNILDLINDRMRQIESEKAELWGELQGLREQADTAVKEKEEAEEKVEAALNDKTDAENKIETLLAEKAETEKRLAETTGNIEALNEQITNLKEDLNKSVTIAETAIREKDQLQEKLNQFQENWEKYMASR